MSYNAEWSKSGILTNHKARKINYGSCGLQGFEWKDFACLNPLKTSNLTKSSEAVTKALDAAKCTDFNFVALYKAFGLQAYDGILGLSPIKKTFPERLKFNYLNSLKENGVIDRAMISFSLASVKNPEL